MTADPFLAAPAAVPFAVGLATFGDRPALVVGNQTITYGELADLLRQARDSLGTTRRLVQVELTPDPLSVAGYLACLAVGHPAIVTAPGAALHRFEPQVHIDAAGVITRRDCPSPVLHPELALLMSTSGSTGSPKLVRLSRTNVRSNAESIATSLAIRPEDRAITSLPLHYCYGLSVLHSHLSMGAAVVLTSLSVTEPCFWSLMAEQQVTTLAGVPYTFELLDRVGFADKDLPALRMVTQAGGRLPPEQAQRWHEVGQRRGWDLCVMYGQTEATARMAVLPPDLLATHPTSVGRAVPGGRFWVDAEPGSDVGELVYEGPNVMLGYADEPADLGLGRTVDALRTGDLARLSTDGVVDIVGRRSRFLKLYGLRVDLDHLEQTLARAGQRVAVIGDDTRLTVITETTGDPALLRRLAAEVTGLPRRCLDVHAVEALPRTPAGKVDGAALRRLPAPTPAPAGRRPRTATEVFALVLDLPLGDLQPEHTFVELGGDSLSHVEAALLLEGVVPRLPADWHLLPLAALDGPTPPPRQACRRVDTALLLRAVATLLVVAHHSELFRLLGGAHLMLGLAGFNFARFQLTPTPRSERVRRLLRTTARIATPAVLAVGLTSLLVDRFDVRHVLLIHDLAASHGPRNFWFVEVLLQVLLVLAAVLAVPHFDRMERRRPLAVPLVLLAVALSWRYDLFPAPPADRNFAPYATCWLFLWGWAAVRSRRHTTRIALSLVLITSLIGFFPAQPLRSAVIGAGLLLVLWARHLPVPACTVRPLTLVARSSLHIYLVTVLVLEAVPGPPLVGFFACVLTGHAFSDAQHRVLTALGRHRRKPSLPAGVR